MNAILVDVTRCTSCDRCVDACVEAHGGDTARAARARVEQPDGLSADRLLSVVPVAEGRFARKSCMHCLEPSCVAACLVGGLTKNADGAVVYDPAKCIGCRYCMLACPFHVPRYEWDELVPLMRKCDMCHERTADGLLPLCVEACPSGVLEFGDREAMLAEARRRIAAAPDSYLPHIWGESEFGGTSVIYVSDVPLDELDWPADVLDPIPVLTASLIEATPVIGLSVAGGVLGLSWIIRRRMKLSREREGIDLAAVGKDTEGHHDG